MNQEISDSSKHSEPIFISLGEWCETAFQINRYTKNSEAYFFNWLITPNDSYKSIFLNDTEFFKPNNWEISENLIRVHDKGTGIFFQHEFEVIDKVKNHIDQNKVENHLPIAQSKFIFLKKKTLKAIESFRTIYLIRQEDFNNIDDALKRIQHIKEIFYPLNNNINIILTSREIKEEIQNGKYLILRNERSSSWQGSNESWDRVFNIALNNSKS